MKNLEIFNSFNPGENFRIHEEWYRKTFLHRKSVQVISPGRLHFSLFNYNEMLPPSPGGGGIGISINAILNDIKIRIDSDKKSNTDTPPNVQHVIALFKKLVGYHEDNIDVSIESKIPFIHSGYGSTVSLSTSVFWGLNSLFEFPFTKEEAFKILTNNFVENSDNQQIHWGLDTGVGEACLLFGGFVLIDEKGKFINNIQVNNIYGLVAKGKMDKLASEDYVKRGLLDNGETGKVEFEILEQVGKIHQKQFGEKLDHFFKEKLVPVFKETNVDKLLKEIWTLNELGTFKRMQLSYNPEVLLKFERTAKTFGAIYSGISSAGPSMFALFSNQKNMLLFKEAIQLNLSNFFDSFSMGIAGNTLKVIH